MCHKRRQERFRKRNVFKLSPKLSAWHRDKPHFDKIFGLSLGDSCKFRFRRAAGDRWERFTLIAESRSLYMMSGDSRQVWEHSIPAVEQRRYSITFRTMRNEAAKSQPRARRGE
jgi:hypothetical protein